MIPEDIPEITSCRHCNARWETPDWEYCPVCSRNYAGAVYPQVSTREEILRARQLKERIEDAFRDVTLGDGLTLEEADLEGTWTKEKAEKLRQHAETTDWQKVESRKIEYMFAALSFFDPQGWLFHIPAFMIWSLDNWRTTDRITADSTIWSLTGYDFLISQGRISKLNKNHVAAIVAFLRFFVDHEPNHSAEVALRDFWIDKLKQFSPPVDR